MRFAPRRERRCPHRRSTQPSASVRPCRRPSTSGDRSCCSSQATARSLTTAFVRDRQCRVHPAGALLTAACAGGAGPPRYRSPSVVEIVRTRSEVDIDEGGRSPTRARARCACRSRGSGRQQAHGRLPQSRQTRSAERPLMTPGLPTRRPVVQVARRRADARPGVAALLSSRRGRRLAVVAVGSCGAQKPRPECHLGEVPGSALDLDEEHPAVDEPGACGEAAPVDTNFSSAVPWYPLMSRMVGRGTSPVGAKG